MKATHQERPSPDDYREEWDRRWGAKTQRVRPAGCNLDLSHFQFGNVSSVTISADPVEFADRVWRESELCPVCGKSTASQPRVAATLNVCAEIGLKLGIGVWAQIVL
ncbi:MAG: hypothetical protein L0Y72_26885 [Gemmataceae bacterium]|nr:hypothetical protein [Gemmataceae bacterium]